jgi:hypothetical protein
LFSIIPNVLTRDALHRRQNILDFSSFLLILSLNFKNRPEKNREKIVFENLRIWTRLEGASGLD